MASSASSEKESGAFRTIGEAAAEIGVPQHVLRFWGERFRHIRPVKGAGGRRYYRPKDIALLHTIRRLLHEEGYTIKGVNRMLHQQGAQAAAERAGQDRREKLDRAVNLLEMAKEKLAAAGRV